MARDLDGDGVPEIITCGDGTPFAITHSGGTFAVMWTGPSLGCVGVTAGDPNGSGANKVIVAGGLPAAISVLDPRSLGPPVASVVLPGTLPAKDVAIGNVDSDPGMEIVTLTSAATYVYDAATLTLKWTAQGYGGSKLALGDINGDGRLHIIVNGPTGFVLDAENKVLEWSYPGGFGLAMAAGDVDGDGKADIVFSDGFIITIVHGGTLAATTIPAHGAVAIAIGDTDNDGANEILYGTNGGNVGGLRPSDGVVLWSFYGGYTDTQAILTADVDGDGKMDVVWITGANSGSPYHLLVGDLVATFKWESATRLPQVVSIVGDIDGEGRAELVIASSSYYYGAFANCVIEVFDVATGMSKGTLPLAYYPSDFSFSHLAIGHVDPDGGTDVIALGTFRDNPIIVVWDGTTHALKWSSTIASTGPKLITSSFLVASLHGDPLDRIIIGRYDSKVLVLRGDTNVIETTLNVDGNVRDMVLADLNADGVPELVVGTSTTLYVFDISSWAVLGQTALTNIQRVAATPLDGGSVAVSTYDSSVSNPLPHIDLFKSAALTPAWSCSSLGTSAISALAFTDIGGSKQLLAGTLRGQLYSLPLAAGTCPAYGSTTVGVRPITNLTVVEATGDSRPDLLIDCVVTTELDLIGWSTELRGDVNGDGLITQADIDLLTDYVFGVAPGLSPAGDVNADHRIGVEDAFQLINYEVAGGPAPPP